MRLLFHFLLWRLFCSPSVNRKHKEPELRAYLLVNQHFNEIYPTPEPTLEPSLNATLVFTFLSTENTALTKILSWGTWLTTIVVGISSTGKRSFLFWCSTVPSAVHVYNTLSEDWWQIFSKIWKWRFFVVSL